MTVDSAPASREPASPSPKRTRRPALRFALVIGGVLLLAAVVFALLTTFSGQELVWLTPTELARSTWPGPFAKVKQKLVSLTPSVVWRFWRKKPIVSINSTLLTMSAEAAGQFGLGAPMATKASGMRAWILSPAELDALRQRLKEVPSATVTGRGSVTGRSGLQAQLQVMDWRLVAGKTTPVGLIVNLYPKVVSGSVKLTVAASATELFAAPPDNALAVRTNFAAACRASIPSTGGLVMDGGNAKSADGKSYWIIVSPAALDARGNPIKP